MELEVSYEHQDFKRTPLVSQSYSEEEIKADGKMITQTNKNKTKVVAEAGCCHVTNGYCYVQPTQNSAVLVFQLLSANCYGFCKGFWFTLTALISDAEDHSFQ